MTNPPSADPVAAEVPSTPASAEPRARLNALAVAALILAVLLSPLAALFGHIAAHQIARSNGRERHGHRLGGGWSRLFVAGRGFHRRRYCMALLHQLNVGRRTARP
jgi:hypothetical protein